MTPEQAAAYVHAQSVAATAEIEGMKALNVYRESRGLAQAYDETEFLNIVEAYSLDGDSIIALFNEANS